MKRITGLLNLAQAGVYLVLAVLLGPSWAPLYAILGLAAVAQVAAGILLFVGKGTPWVRIASWLSLAAVAVVLGLFLQLAVHAIVYFHEGGQATGWGVVGGVALALPWLIFLPIGQLLASRPSRREGAGAGAAVVVALLLPPAWQLVAEAPSARYAAVDGRQVAEWAQVRREGRARPAPTAEGPVLVVISAVHRGRVRDSQVLTGDTLEAALSQWERPTAARAATLVIDVAEVERPIAPPWLTGPGRTWLPEGQAGLRTASGVVGSSLWRSSAARPLEVLPDVDLVILDLEREPALGATHSLALRTWMVGPQGVVEAPAGWAAPPELDADAVLEAALAGARMVARNQHEDGRYAYRVRGPSGRLAKGYSYARHAGTTWFLARAASRSGDPTLRRAARRGLDHLGEHLATYEDGRGYVHDPLRTDGRAWVGTTALSLLAALELGEREDLSQAWTALLVSAVDDQGIVRGELDMATGEWPQQRRIAYGQGQAALALASAARAGDPDARQALERVADAWEGLYWPMPSGTLLTLGEHWSCLAALTTQEVLGRPVDWRVCESYLRVNSWLLPEHQGPLVIPTGGLAGSAEAVVAAAERDRRAGRDGPWREQALAYGRAFLASSYRAADAPLLIKAAPLLGGFRDSPSRLDVRVDTVQHAGCALLGLEQLLRDQALPGGAP